LLGGSYPRLLGFDDLAIFLCEADGDILRQVVGFHFLKVAEVADSVAGMASPSGDSIKSQRGSSGIPHGQKKLLLPPADV
jgi:hypothetical protein